MDKTQEVLRTGLLGDTGAVFSDCGNYRYSLWRIWDEAKPYVCFLMLNPSTANEVENDPTIERCQRRSMSMAYGGIFVINLYAYRSTDPAALDQVEDPIGPLNDKYIAEVAQNAGIVICGWGNSTQRFDRHIMVIELLKRLGVKPMCLAKNKDGSPKHPLYVSYDAQPIPL